MRTTLLRPLLLSLLTFSLVAAACSDDGGETTTDDTSTTAAADEPDTGADETDDQGDETGDETAPDDEGGDESVVLEASDRGITEDIIRIGVAIPDVSAFSNTGDIPARYQVVADAINANGGVLGRDLELVVREWDLADTTGFEATCLELTEDIEVFAVITRTPANFGAMTCFTSLGDTITINGLDLDDAELAESGGRLFSIQSDRFSALRDGIDQLADELADARIAITASEDPGSEENAAELAAVLDDLGLDVVATTIGTVAYADDSTASLSEQDRFSQVWISEGATHVIGLGNGVIGATYAIDNNALNDDLVLITPNINVRNLGALGVDLSRLQMLGVAVDSPFGTADRGLYGTEDCLTRVETELGETIVRDPDPDDVNNLPSSLNACASFDALIAGLEAAGPNPTREAFLAAAAAGLGFAMTGAENASLDGTVGYLNLDGGRIYDWDGTDFVVRG